MPELNFLIVDDDEITTYFLRKIIEKKYKTDDIDVFKNPRNALKMAKRKNYDLILTDICMDSMDGFEFYQKVKELKDTPVVLMTGSPEERDFQRKAEELGAEIMPKPLDSQVVIDMMSKYVPLPASS